MLNCVKNYKRTITEKQYPFVYTKWCKKDKDKVGKLKV